VMHHGRRIAEDEPDRVLSDPHVIEAYLGERYAKQRQARQAGPTAPTDPAAAPLISGPHAQAEQEAHTQAEQEGGTASP